jgi:hypothetical protein
MFHALSGGSVQVAERSTEDISLCQTDALVIERCKEFYTLGVKAPPNPVIG